MGRTSASKMRWSLWSERFWPKSPFKRSDESSTNGSRDYMGALRMRGSTSK
jgi:hypothetical protein